MNHLATVLLASVAALAPWHVQGQVPAWPNHPIRLVAPSGPGGVLDIRARWLAERLGAELGQPVLVENKSGAGGNIGMEQAIRSAPDGYTLVMVHQGIMTINPHRYARLGYDPLVDVRPITRVGVGPLLLAVHPDVPARSVAELITLAKERPGMLTFGSNGIGTPPHLAGELFKRMAAIDLIHAPYRGGGQATSDLIAGHISMSIEGVTVVLPQILAGKLRPLAVTGRQRLALLPDVPTMAEAGLPDYEYSGWVGLAAPAGVPSAIVERIYRASAAVLTRDEGRKWFATFGAEPGAESPDEFARLVQVEHAKWNEVIRAAGIKVE